jgi:hypothetical protein
MSKSTSRLDRRAAVGIVAICTAIAIFSFSVVRAEHVNPDRSKTFNCSSGTACVEGDSSGSKTYGVYGRLSATHD